jgi:hypothetical protein
MPEKREKDMPWTLTLHAHAGYIETAYTGLLTAAELNASVQENVRIARRENLYRFFSDCSKLEGGHTILDLYAVTDELEVLRGTRSREALLMPQLEAVQRDVQFWEDACVNRGFVVRVFTAREPALAWLLDAIPAT